MKKIVMIVVLVTGLFLTFNKKVISWVETNFVSKPTPYYQQRQQFFEKLSIEYYGVSDYGEELEVINRTFQTTESDVEQVDLIIPSLDAINRLKQRRTIALVENDPYTRIVQKGRQPLTGGSGREKVIDKADHFQSSTIILLVSAIIVSVVISLMGYVKYRRKMRQSALLRLPDDEPIISDDRILLDFDLSSYEEKRQKPDSTYIKQVA